MEWSQNSLATEPIGKLIAKFAIPSVVAMLVNALYNIVDQLFIIRGVGYLGNGATNVVLLITMITLAFSLLIGDGAAAHFSLSLGAGEPEDAAHSVGTATVLITAVSVLCMGAGLLFLEPILRLFGSTDLILPYAKDYGFIIVLGLPFIMISTSLNALIRADGSPRYAMISMIVGAVANACMDPIFIFGFGWGIRGAALSTLLGQMISFVMSVSYLRKFQHVTLTKEQFRPRCSVAGKISGLGISSFIDQISFSLVMAVNNNLIVHYGALTQYGSEIPLTAYGISMKIQEIVFTLVLGIAIGMQPIVGFNRGAGNHRRVRKAYAMAVAIGTAVSLLAMVLFVFVPGPIIRLFGGQGNFLYSEFSEKFFRTYFLLILFLGFQTISGVFFQAIGKPRQAAVLSLSYQLVFKIGTAVILSTALGLNGVLWSGPAADLLAFFMTAVFVWVELRRQEGRHGETL